MTSPTQPTPTTPIGSVGCRSLNLCASSMDLAIASMSSSSSVRSSVFESQYELFSESCQAIRCEPVAVVVEVEGAVADLDRVGGVLEDRRVGPGRSLDPVVLGQELEASRSWMTIL